MAVVGLELAHELVPPDRFEAGHPALAVGHVLLQVLEADPDAEPRL